MRIVLLGPPGAGKGTQAVLICKRYSIPHISTGEMLRDAVASGSELGKAVKSVLDSGELVTDTLIMQVVADRLGRDDCSRGYLLDGVPRTVAQAEMLQVMLKERGSSLSSVVQLSVPEQVLELGLLALAAGFLIKFWKILIIAALAFGGGFAKIGRAHV